MIRDSLLAVSGRLDSTLGGTLVDWKNNEYAPGDSVSAGSLRRMIYLPVVRDRMYDVMTIFDCANPSVGSARRVTTVVAHQALFFLNSPLVLDASRKLAEQILQSFPGSRDQQVRAAYRRILVRHPGSTEESRAEKFFSDPNPAGADSASRLTLFCQALFSSNEFLHRE